MSKRFSHAEVAQWFLDKGSKLTSPYINASTRIYFICAKCRKETSHSKYTRLKKDNPACLCQECRLDKVRISLETVQKWFLDRGSELYNEIKAIQDPVIFKCSQCGRAEKYCSFHSLRHVNPQCRCKECNNKIWNQDTLEKWFQDRGSKLLSKYLKNTTPLNYLCSKCGNVETKDFAHLQDNDKARPHNALWCQECVKQQMSERFTYPEEKAKAYLAFKRFLKKELFLILKDDFVVDVVTEQEVEQNFLLKKQDYFQQGVNYIPVLETELLEKPKIFDSLFMLKTRELSKLTKLHARKLQIKELGKQEASLFLTENHRQSNYPSEINIGLINPDTQEIVSAMSFSKPRFNKDYEYELIRFCSKLYHVIPGAASKLFKFFIEKHTPKNIISYCDIRFSSFDSDKTVYKRLGFTLSHVSKPNYFYLKDGKIHSRIKFQKHKLSKLLPVFDPSLSEKENMLRNGYIIYEDCGNFVFTYKKAVK